MKTEGYTMDNNGQTIRDPGTPIAAKTLKSYLSRFSFAPSLTVLPDRKRGVTRADSPARALLREEPR